MTLFTIIGRWAVRVRPHWKAIRWFVVFFFARFILFAAQFLSFQSITCKRVLIKSEIMYIYNIEPTSAGACLLCLHTHIWAIFIRLGVYFASKNAHTYRTRVVGLSGYITQTIFITCFTQWREMPCIVLSPQWHVLHVYHRCPQTI